MTKEEFIEKTRETMLSLLHTYRAEFDPKAEAIYADASIYDTGTIHNGVHVLYCEKNNANEYDTHELLNYRSYLN